MDSAKGAPHPEPLHERKQHRNALEHLVRHRSADIAHSVESSSERFAFDHGHHLFEALLAQPERSITHTLGSNDGDPNQRVVAKGNREVGRVDDNHARIGDVGEHPIA